MRLLNKFILGLLILWSIHSCGFRDDFDEVPTILEINELSLTTKAGQGADTEAFKDVWVSANGDLLGVFTPPVKIPILSEQDEIEIFAFAGIRNNGDNQAPFQYSMTSSEVFSINRNPGETITKNLEFEYRDDIIFEMVEGFEGSNIILNDDRDEDLETNIERTTDVTRSGNYAAYLEVSEDHSAMEVATQFSYNTDNIIATAYIELDYLSETNMLMGIIAEAQGVVAPIDFIVMPPREEWNKIYIDLTLLLRQSNAESFRIYFRTVYDGIDGNPQRVYLDNLKYIVF